MIIYASTNDGRIALLEDNQIKKIGFVTHTKSFNDDGTLTLTKTVFFYFGTTHFDYFTFENNRLKNHAVSFRSPSYLTDVYKNCINKDLTIKEFIDEVAGEYTIKEMGF